MAGGFLIVQKELQHRGGKCVKFPVSCLIYDMLKELGLQPERLTILDTTFGEGRFYGAWRPKLLIGSDIRVLNWLVEPDVFIRKPSWSVWRIVSKLGVKPDLIVVDPPFSPYERGYEKRKHYMQSLAFGDGKAILEGGLESARKLGCSTVLVHYNELYVPDGWQLVKHIEFLFFTRYLKQDMNNKTLFYVLERGDQ